MGNEAEVKKSSPAERALSTDAIVRKMAKRALPDLQAKQAAGAAKEPPRDDTTQRLIRSNLSKAARLRSARDMPAGAAPQ
jgi:hypothetical protein